MVNLLSLRWFLVTEINILAKAREDVTAFDRLTGSSGRLLPDTEPARRWDEKALCLTVTPVNGDFMDDNDPTPDMGAICAACPVRVDCLVDDLLATERDARERFSDYEANPALIVQPDDAGLFHLVRGGLSARQRQLLSMRNTRRRHVLAACRCGNLFTHLLGAEYGKSADGVGTPSSRGCSLECIRANPSGEGVTRPEVDYDGLTDGIKHRSSKLKGLV